MLTTFYFPFRNFKDRKKTLSMVLCAVFLNLAYLFLSATADCAHKQEKYVSGDNKNVAEALQFLRDHDRLASENANKLGLASWNYQSNLTEENKNAMVILHT